MNAFSSEQIRERTSKRLREAIEGLRTDVVRPDLEGIAREAGLSRSMLSQLMHGKVTLSVSHAERLAPVLGVSAAFLLGVDTNRGDAA